MNTHALLGGLNPCVAWNPRRDLLRAIFACFCLTASSVVWAQSLTPQASALESSTLETERALVEQWMACEGAVQSDLELDALQRVLSEQSAQERDELQHAFKRARRAARLPEVIRVQTGGRYDRDQQNRKRLTEDYDDMGAIRKSALENRDTYQDDMYINVQLSAEWRITQTRWSRDEVALRREQTALRKAQKERAAEAMKRWFALHEARLTWCEMQSQDDPYQNTATSNQRQKLQQRARLTIWQELSELNALTDGWFLEAINDPFISSLEASH